VIGRDDHTTDPGWWFEREFELAPGRLDVVEPDRSAERA